MHHLTAIIAAGGSGTRMNAGVNKQYLQLLDKPVLVHTWDLFERSPLVNEIIVVVPKDEIEHCKKEIIKPLGFTKIERIVGGGAERQDSVYNGLTALDDSCEYVAVHDGARPLLTSETLSRVVMEGFRHGAAVAAVPLKDTIKTGNTEGFVTGTPERSGIWTVQTPQVFEKGLLVRAYEYARRVSFVGTDDSMLVEKLGAPVKLVLGDYENIKITARGYGGSFANTDLEA